MDESNTEVINVVEKIQEPEYTPVNITPNKPYNNLEGEVFADTINNFYNESMKFRKNLFLVPTGNSGKELSNS